MITQDELLLSKKEVTKLVSGTHETAALGDTALKTSQNFMQVL